MSTIEIKVPDIGDFKNIPVIEVHVKPGQTIAAEEPRERRLAVLRLGS